MITGLIAGVFIIAMIAAAGNGETGVVLVAAAVAVFVLALGSASRECDRAYGNFVKHWSKGGPDKK